MTKFNTFYLIVFSVGVALAIMTNVFEQQIHSFYGVAADKETMVSRNYDLRVNEIFVAPDQQVVKGQKLLAISRTRTEEKWMEQDNVIDELRAKETDWSQIKSNEIRTIESDKVLAINDINVEIEFAENDLKRKQALLQDLSSLNVGVKEFTALEEKIASLKERKRLLLLSFDEQISSAKGELKTGKSPYSKQIARLRAEKKFYDDTRVIYEEIVAPHDGMIGKLNCKIGEDIASFTALLTIYEPHPILVTGYIPEDLTLPIKIQDSFFIRSNKDRNILYKGTVTGQGSRVVAIPPRFSRDPAVTLYGIQINIEIPKDNAFRQNEKVILEYRPKRETNETGTETEQASNISF